MSSNGYATNEAATTSDTLNHALGNLGGKRKQWMIPGRGGFPVAAAKTPTTSTSTTTAAAAATTTTTPTATIATPTGTGTLQHSPHPQSNVLINDADTGRVHDPSLAHARQNVSTTVTPHPPPRPPSALAQTQIQVQTRPKAPRQSCQSPYSHSPTLPNVLPPQTLARNLPSPATAFPSPSPSNASGTRTPLAASASPRETHAQLSPDAHFMEGVRQAAVGAAAGHHKRPPDIPARQQMPTLDKRMRVDTGVQPTPYTPATSTSAATATPTMATTMPLHPHDLPSYHQAQARPQPRPPPPARPSHRARPSQPVALAPSHHTPTLARPVHATGTPLNPQGHPSSRGLEPSATAEAWHPAHLCLRLIRSYRQRDLRADAFPWDEKRLNAIENAVRKNDWVFVFINQVYCVHFWCLESLPPTLKAHHNLNLAMNLLGEVLGSNVPLSQTALAFFAEFPASLTGLASLYPAHFKDFEMLTLDFFHRSHRWTVLKPDCIRRAYPPLMRELVHDLGIVSPVLQRIVFTSALRHIWSSLHNPYRELQEQFEVQALQIFDDNQKEFYSWQTNGVRVPEVESRMRFEESQKCGKMLQQLCDRFRQTRHALPSSAIPATSGQLPPDEQQQLLHSRLVVTPTVPSTPGPSQMFPPTVPSQPASQAIRINAIPTSSAHARGRQGRQPPVRTSRPRPHSYATSPQVALAPSVERLFPPPGQSLPQQRLPDPARFALHQADLRSPTMQAQPAKQPLYHFVTGYVKPPQRLTDAGHKVEKWMFNLSKDDLQTIPATYPGDSGPPPSRVVSQGHCLIRLRCVKWTSDTLPDEHKWSVADTSWIPHSSFVLNGEHLFQRKKLHHGKDMPIDLTALVKEGENVLEIAIARTSDDDSYLKYLVAIEMLGFMSHDDIVDLCRTQHHINAAETTSRIQKKLGNPSGGNNASDSDDDIAIVESSLTVSLLDPFSASKICDMPARGRACLHYDCFDLATFLQTRKLFGDVSSADHWKCPICSGDARPKHLVVDGFMEHVRDELVKQGLEHCTRAIVLDQQGRWKPKVEVLEGVAEPDTPEEPSRVGRSRQKIIDLSD